MERKRVEKNWPVKEGKYEEDCEREKRLTIRRYRGRVERRRGLTGREKEDEIEESKKKRLKT